MNPNHTDRAIERCGRRAAELLVAGDIVLADSSAEPMLTWLLAALAADTRAALRVVGLDAVAAGCMPTLCLFGASLVASDGGAVCSTAAWQCVDLAHTHNLPCYLFAPHGPDPALPDASVITLSPGRTYLPPNQISAIITDRALYRPAMIARYHGDADTPLDLIPLLG
jgi:hypothetical protein